MILVIWIRFLEIVLVYLSLQNINYYWDIEFVGVQNIFVYYFGVFFSQNYCFYCIRISYQQYSEYVIIYRGLESFVGYLIYVRKGIGELFWSQIVSD